MNTEKTEVRINIAQQRKTFVIYLNSEDFTLTYKAVEELVPDQAGRVILLCSSLI